MSVNNFVQSKTGMKDDLVECEASQKTRTLHVLHVPSSVVRRIRAEIGMSRLRAACKTRGKSYTDSSVIANKIINHV